MNDAVHRRRFDDWVREHAGVLHRIANGFAVGDDRKDLMQELLLSLWRAVPAFAGASKPSTFIYKVAHNAALTWRRNGATYRRHVDRFQAESLNQPGDATPDRESETLQHVYREIRQLPELDRSLILLHLEGLSHAAVGEIHGLTENNVGVRLSRIKERLASNLKELTHELR